MVYILRMYYNWNYESDKEVEDCCQLIIRKEEPKSETISEPKTEPKKSNESGTEINLYNIKKTFTPTNKSNKSNKYQKRRKQFNFY